MRAFTCIALLSALVAIAAARAVLTPHGYMPSECVHHAPEGSLVEHDPITNRIRIAHADGTHKFVGDVSCGKFLKLRKQQSELQEMPNGWTAFTSWKSPIPADVTTMLGTWNVPARPQITSDSQTLFTFTGLQNAFNSEPPEGVFIIQPVLQWGPSAAGGGAYWAIASWYVGGSGAVYSALQTVAPGDSIFGNMTLTDPKGEKWFINTVSKSTGKQSSITVKTPAKEPWAFVTLEVYGVSACKDFPQGTIAYTGVSLAHDKSTLHPKWQKESQNACQEKVEVLSESSINLKF